MIRTNSRPLLDVTAHELVAKTAEEMAFEIFEDLAKNNHFYSENPDAKEFVRHIAPRLRGAARTVLGQLLGSNSVSEIEKEQIYEALILDNSLPKGGVGAVQIREPKGKWI